MGARPCGGVPQGKGETMQGNRAHGLDRRRVLQMAAAAGLAAPLASGRAWGQSKEPLKLGITEPLTGSEAGYGADFVTVMRRRSRT